MCSCLTTFSFASPGILLLPLHDALSLEVGEKHLLYTVEARAVARRQEKDDLLL